MNKELVVLTAAFALAAGIVFAQEMKAGVNTEGVNVEAANAENMNAEATNTENMNAEATNTEATNTENMNAQVPTPAEDVPAAAPAAEPKY